MNENYAELLGRLVTGHKRDGRCAYDPEAKLELIRLCLKPGVSIARTANQFGLNANLLRTWVTRYQKECLAASAAEKPAEVAKRESVFAAVQIDPNQTHPVRTREVPPNLPSIARQVSPLSPAAAEAPAPTLAIRMQVRLPNGVEFNLGEASVDELSPVMQMLSKLPCSGSTTR
jgi:transposase